MDEKLSINGTKGISDLSSDKSMYDSIIQVPDKDLSPPSYTMPGVLHFLQSEWAKMESERGHWEIERAELQARIAFLQGERKGQENLKQDLVRRIKMLEYALKQERLKFQRWKHGETGAKDIEENGKKSDDEAPEELEYDPAAILAKTTQQVAASNAKWKESRTKLRQYLQEVGFTDTVVDARQARLREIMGGVPSHLQYSRAGSGVVNGGPLSQGSGVRAVSLTSRCSGVAALAERIRDETSCGLSGTTNNSSESVGVDGVDEEEAETRSVLENFNFLSGATDEDDDDDIPAVRVAEKDGKIQNAEDEVESALEEFDILVSRGGCAGTNVELERTCINNLGEGEDEDEEEIEWTSPETLMRKLKAGRGAGKRATLRSMLASLNAGEEDEDDQDDPDHAENLTEGVPHVTINTNAGSDTGDTVGRKKSSSMSSQPQDWLVGLGDLATLTVANEAEDEIRCREAHAERPVSSSMSSPNSVKSTVRRTWSVRYALRSHFDAVRALAFHPTEPCLISASEDGTLKLWNIKMPPPGPTVGAKKNIGPGCDVEPCYTFRGHDAPVLCVRFASGGRSAYSSDLTGHIREWIIPDRLTVAPDPDTGSNAAGVEEGVDLYEPFEMCAVHGRGWAATSAVWNITVIGDRLISLAADGTVAVWNLLRNDEVEDDDPRLIDEMKIPLEDEDVRPTSMVCLPLESEDDSVLPRILVGLTNGIVLHIDLNTKETLLTLKTVAEDEDDTPLTSTVHCLAVHPLTTTIVAVGYEDKRIRFFDLTDGKCQHSMVAHLDAVTCLDVDPSGLYLLSGSHDCSLRIWNFETKACIQEITSHRKKFDESIHAVAFHPSKALMASGGADATARVFVS